MQRRGTAPPELFDLIVDRVCAAIVAQRIRFLGRLNRLFPTKFLLTTSNRARIGRNHNRCTEEPVADLARRVDAQFAATRFSDLLSVTSRGCEVETEPENCDSMLVRGHQVQM